MKPALPIAKALADESRLRLLMALAPGELCVCQLTEFVKLAPSTVSKHLSILRDAGLIAGRKSGRWMFYRSTEPNGHNAEGRAVKWVHSTLKDDPQALDDRRTLEQILLIHPEELCQIQSRK